MGGIFLHSVAWFRRQVADFLDILYPPVCGLCGRPADSDDGLICSRCWDFIKGLEAPYCSVCRQFLFQSIECPICRPRPMVVFSLGYYETRLQTIIHDLKFQGLKPLAVGLGRRLAELIAPKLDQIQADVVIPVPLHDSRLHRRGFNQAEEIARETARRLGLPLQTALLTMIRKTRQQAKLPAAQRESNVRGAFTVNDEAGFLRGKKILLIDDVTTTGATLRENARVLHRAGARKIVAGVAATAL